jgi:hypothetical protein
MPPEHTDAGQERGFGCERCWPSTPDEAWEARRQLERTRELINESHFHVMILACSSCGQSFLSVFTELVDFGGDDSQGRVLMPVTSGELRGLAEIPQDALEGEIYRIGRERRGLLRAYPRGGTPACSWRQGIPRLPHD